MKIQEKVEKWFPGGFAERNIKQRLRMHSDTITYYEKQITELKEKIEREKKFINKEMKKWSEIAKNID